MDTVLLTILALLFVITIFLSLYHSNTIKVNKEYFPLCGTTQSNDPCDCCKVTGLTNCTIKKQSKFSSSNCCTWENKSKSFPLGRCKPK